MADLIIPVASVHTPTGTKKEAVASVIIAAGQTISVSNGVATLANRILTGTLDGIAVCSAQIGQPVLYVSSGLLSLETLLLGGQTYAVGSADGGIELLSLVGTNEYVSYVGIAKDNTILDLGILRATGVQIAP